MNKYALSASGPWAATCMLLRGVIHPGGNTDEPFNSSRENICKYTRSFSLHLYVLFYSPFLSFLSSTYDCVLLRSFISFSTPFFSWFWPSMQGIMSRSCKYIKLNRLTGFIPF